VSAPRGEIVRITLSMTAACAVGAFLLGGVYVGTQRYQDAARRDTERRAVNTLLGLGPGAEIVPVGQMLAPAREEVLYRTPDSAYVFSYDGRLLRRSGAALAAGDRGLVPAGRLFVAREKGETRGFVVEGDTRGYKNRIRFFVAIDPSFHIAGVQVLEHEEDPGLGAETATPWFTGQYIGRAAADLPALSVTRDPLPEDWRGALLERTRAEGPGWVAKHRALVNEMAHRPIYAVTGATISSRALTEGVKSTVLHFQRRWQLLEPFLGGRS
jgi:electron transport complex protein RnfG